MGALDYRGPDLNMNGIPDWEEAQASPVTQGALAPSPMQMSPVAPVGILAGSLPGVNAPAGGPAAAPGMVPPEMSGLERGLSGIYNLGTLMGGRGPELNPMTQAFDQRVQNYELATQRMRSLHAAQQDNPFYDYELAKSRGYFKLNEGEDDAQGFRRFTQEQFKDPTKSVYSQKVEGLVASGIDEGLANQFVNGAVEVKEGPGGIQQIINSVTGEVEGTLTPEQAATIESTVARGKKFGEDIQGQINDYIGELAILDDAQYEMADLTEFSGQWLDRLSAKNADGSYAFQTGPLQGLMGSLGLGTEAIGELSADDIFQRLQSLQIVNLAPVTQQEMKAMGELFANPNSINEQNIGKIKSFMRKIQREQKSLDRQRGRVTTWLSENEGNLTSYDRNFLDSNYGNWRPKKVDY